MRVDLNISHKNEVVNKRTKRDYALSYFLKIDNSDHSGLADVVLNQTMTGVDDRDAISASPIILLGITVSQEIIVILFFRFSRPSCLHFINNVGNQVSLPSATIAFAIFFLVHAEIQ